MSNFRSFYRINRETWAISRTAAAWDAFKLTLRLRRGGDAK